MSQSRYVDPLAAASPAARRTTGAKFDNPERNQRVLANLVANLRLIHVIPLLQELTFDQVVELWWHAQNTRPPIQEKPHARS